MWIFKLGYMATLFLISNANKIWYLRQNLTKFLRNTKIKGIRDTNLSNNKPNIQPKERQSLMFYLLND